MDTTNKLENIFAQSGEIASKDSASRLLLNQEAIPDYSASGAGLFSYFNAGICGHPAPSASITVAQLHHVITNPPADLRRRCDAARAEFIAAGNSDDYKKLKQQLDHVSPSGTFAPWRGANNFQKRSGWFVLDFDSLPDLDAARAALLNDELLKPEIGLLFTSPSGSGLKVLVAADSRVSHLDNFNGYADYVAEYHASLGLVADRSGKDLARACFMSYAPDAWLNPIYS